MQRFELQPRITVFQSRAANWRVNSGIIAAADGGVMLIDPGVLPGEIAELKAAIGARPVHYLIHTHHHAEHSFGLSAWPDAVRVGSIHHTHFADAGQRVVELAAEAERKYDMVWRPTVAYLPPVRAVECPEPLDDELLPGWQVIPAPGHTPDSLMLFHEPSGTLWAGDAVTDARDVPTIDQCTLVQAIQTLDMLKMLNIERLIPGRGEPAQTAGEARAYINANRTYLAELRQRVQAAAEAGQSLETVIKNCVDLSCDEWQKSHEHNIQVAWTEATGQPHNGVMTRLLMSSDCP